MADNSAIEWTDATWNPIVGCSILTPGCTNCYAMKMAARIEAMNAAAYAALEVTGLRRSTASQYDGTTKKVNGNAVWTGKLALAGDNILLQPLKRKKPTTYFVNSMGDLFHEDCPDEWIDKIFAVMALAPQHTFQVLTKRAGRMREYLAARDGMGNSAICGAINLIPNNLGNRHGALSMPLPNVWLGVSAERQQEADERVRLLLDTPAAIRFVSAEPLLGPLDLTRICILPQKPGSIRAGIHLNALAGRYCESGVTYKGDWDITRAPPPDSERRKLDWVIAGGESGPGSRPMHPDWARSLRDQCSAAGVRFFFKQWGQFVPFQGGLGDPRGGGVNYYHPTMKSVGKKAAGRLLDGVEHNAMPEIAR